VVVVDPNFDLELRLAPETGAIGTGQSYSRIEICELELSVFTEEFNARLVFGILAEVILSQQFEADALGSCHFVFGLELHPFAPGADAIALILVRAHCATLGEAAGTEHAGSGESGEGMAKQCVWIHEILSNGHLLL
jgi:hypothetical protein